MFAYDGGIFSVAAHDKANYDYYATGKTDDIPYCLINSDKFRPRETLCGLLQECPEYHRTSEAMSLESFTGRLDLAKNIWRTGQMFRDVVFLNTESRLRLKNTGTSDLLVGEAIYALPAIPSMSAHHPHVNLFSLKDKTYVHPMLIGSNERSKLIKDLIAITQETNGTDSRTSMPSSIVGEFLAAASKTSDVDAELIMSYVMSQSPVGSVLCSMDSAHLTVIRDAQSTVRLGSMFVCQMNDFCQ